MRRKMTIHDHFRRDENTVEKKYFLQVLPAVDIQDGAGDRIV